jgi:hypothetical protein
MAPDETSDLDYLPFFYSRDFFFLIMAILWGKCWRRVHFGDFPNGRFGVYWVNEGCIIFIGVFLEGGAKEE